MGGFKISKNVVLFFYLLMSVVRCFSSENFVTVELGLPNEKDKHDAATTWGDFFKMKSGIDFYSLWGDDEVKLPYNVDKDRRVQVKSDDFIKFIGDVVAKFANFPLASGFIESFQEAVFNCFDCSEHKSVGPEVYNKYSELSEDVIIKYAVRFVNFCIDQGGKIGVMDDLCNKSFLRNTGIKIFFNEKEVDTCEEFGIKGPSDPFPVICVTPFQLLKRFYLDKNGEICKNGECVIFFCEDMRDFHVCIKDKNGEEKEKISGELGLGHWIFEKDKDGKYKFLSDNGLKWDSQYHIEVTIKEEKIRENLVFMESLEPVFEEGKKKLERMRKMRKLGEGGACDNCCSRCCSGCCQKCCR